MKKRLLIISIALLTLTGCGGGGGSSSPLPTNTAVIFGATDTFGNLTTAIRGITVTATLPAGVTPNLSGERTLQLGETGLKSLKDNAAIPFGRYSATTNQVMFAVVANPINGTIGLGNFARLTYVSPPGVTPVEAAFQQASYRVSGPNGVDISAKLSRTITLATYPRP
jgi:hypothetical protein